MMIYIAGPMRYLRYYNHPAFAFAARKLRADGHEVFSPAERDLEHFNPYDLPEDHDWSEAPPGFNLQECIMADVTALLRCDTIYLLAGATASVGASAEIAVARWAGLRFMGVKGATC